MEGYCLCIVWGTWNCSRSAGLEIGERSFIEVREREADWKPWRQIGTHVCLSLSLTSGAQRSVETAGALTTEVCVCCPGIQKPGGVILRDQDSLLTWLLPHTNEWPNRSVGGAWGTQISASIVDSIKSFCSLHWIFLHLKINYLYLNSVSGPQASFWGETSLRHWWTQPVIRMKKKSCYLPPQSNLSQWPLNT